MLSKKNLVTPTDHGVLRELWSLPVNTQAQEKVIAALEREPFLTITQIAGLFYSVKRDGTPSKSRKFNPRKTKVTEYEVVAGYDSAKPLLRRMYEKGLLRRFQPDASKKALYHLPGIKVGKEERLYGHEMDCADMFVALWRTGYLTRWERRWDEEQRVQVGERFDVWPDRIFELEGSDDVYFLEVDRGSEEIETQLRDKLDRYVKMGNALKGVSFRVVFTSQPYRTKQPAEVRFRKMAKLIGEYRRGNQFLVALHSKALENPLSEVFYSPGTDKHVSLQGL